MWVSGRLCPDSASQHGGVIWLAWKALPASAWMQQRGIETPVEVLLADGIAYNLSFSIYATRQIQALRAGTLLEGEYQVFGTCGLTLLMRTVCFLLKEQVFLSCCSWGALWRDSLCLSILFYNLCWRWVHG